MYSIVLNKFKKEAIKKINEALIVECHIRVKNPEYLLDTILNLCEKYHQLAKEEEF